jgi:hypothetical protein
MNTLPTAATLRERGKLPKNSFTFNGQRYKLSERAAASLWSLSKIAEKYPLNVPAEEFLWEINSIVDRACAEARAKGQPAVTPGERVALVAWATRVWTARLTKRAKATLMGVSTAPL